jgi:DNA helicase IV
MSKLFFERMRTELFILFVEARREKVQRELDDEVERITGKECDEAARTLSRADFKRVAEEAMKNIKKRKRKSTEREATTNEVGVAAYA